MEAEKEANVQRNMPWILKGGVPIILGLCVCTMIIFAVDGVFPNNTLFNLLSLLQFLAGFLIVLSLCSLVFNIWRLLRHPRVKYVLCLGFYLLSGIFGAVVMFLGSFIIAASGGNI